MSLQNIELQIKEVNIKEVNIKEVNINIKEAYSPLTCVSGFWPIKNKHGNRFAEWFKKTLRINCPYVFFTTKEGIEIIKSYRLDLPTHYIEYNIEDFYTFKYKDKMITHQEHCPSVELNLIWNEKMIMMEKACQINIFNSDFFCWVDAGVCVYREQEPPSTPFPDVRKLNDLPKDRLIYSSSGIWTSKLVQNNRYYHYISGTSYILHKDIVTHFTDMYKKYMERIFMDNTINRNIIWTDQVILTHMFKNYPYKFYKLSDGYGMNLITLS
jgi:hypothetical protein